MEPKTTFDVLATAAATWDEHHMHLEDQLKELVVNIADQMAITYSDAMSAPFVAGLIIGASVNNLVDEKIRATNPMKQMLDQMIPTPKVDAASLAAALIASRIIHGEIEL